MVVVEVGVDLELCKAAHGYEFAFIPETCIFIYEKKAKVNMQ